MEALRDLVIARTGYPRHGALADAARESGIAQSQLSRVVDGVHADIKPRTLRQFAAYLNVPYNELLVAVLGEQGQQQPLHPVTPHEHALRAADVIAAAAVELRQALVAMAQASQESNNPRKKRSPTKNTDDYIYQIPLTRTEGAGVPMEWGKITQLRDRRPAQIAA